MRRIHFVTHPDVVIDPAIPVPRWPLSARGLERMRSLLERPWVKDLAAVWSSDEQKAIDGARVLAEHLGIVPGVMAELGENDRSSTGFLARHEFQATADAFFARPAESVRGWERAADAQARIIAAVQRAAAESPGAGPIAVVSHGGVATLLLCHILREPISRHHEQPGTTGGHCFSFELPAFALVDSWTPIEIG